MLERSLDFEFAADRTSPAYNHRMVRPRCDQNVPWRELQPDVVFCRDLAHGWRKRLLRAERPPIQRRTEQFVTGIRQRHIAAEGQTSSDLAYEASREALKAAGVSTDEVDLIVVATSTPDQIFPSTACLLQARLGIHGCPAFDVQAVCSGFVYALTIADNFLRGGRHRCALVVGAEVFSRILDWNDRGTAVLFGDGAGAIVLRADTMPGILATALHEIGRAHV